MPYFCRQAELEARLAEENRILAEKTERQLIERRLHDPLEQLLIQLSLTEFAQNFRDELVEFDGLIFFIRFF